MSVQSGVFRCGAYIGVVLVLMVSFLSGQTTAADSFDLVLKQIPPAQNTISAEQWRFERVIISVADGNGKIVPDAGVTSGGVGCTPEGVLRIGLNKSRLPAGVMTLTVQVLPLGNFVFSGKAVVQVERDHLENVKPVEVRLVRDESHAVQFQLVSGIFNQPISGRSLSLCQDVRGTVRAIAKATSDADGKLSFKLREGQKYEIWDSSGAADCLDTTAVEFHTEQADKVQVLKSPIPCAVVELFVVDESGKRRLMSEANTAVTVIGTTTEPYTSPGYRGTSFQEAVMPHGGTAYLFGFRDGIGLRDGISIGFRDGTYEVRLISSVEQYSHYVIEKTPTIIVTKGGELKHYEVTLRGK